MKTVLIQMNKKCGSYKAGYQQYIEVNEQEGTIEEHVIEMLEEYMIENGLYKPNRTEMLKMFEVLAVY